MMPHLRSGSVSRTKIWKKKIAIEGREMPVGELSVCKGQIVIWGQEHKMKRSRISEHDY